MFWLINQKSDGLKNINHVKNSNINNVLLDLIFNKFLYKNIEISDINNMNKLSSTPAN